MLWVAYNGFVGYGPVGVVVEAEEEAGARERASAALRVEACRDGVRRSAAEAERRAQQYATVEEIEPITLPWHLPT